MFNHEFIKIYNDYYFNKEDFSKILTRFRDFTDDYNNNALHYVVLSEDLVLLREIKYNLDEKSFNTLLNSKNIFNETPVDWIFDLEDKYTRNKALSILNVNTKSSKYKCIGKALLIEEINK